VTKTCQECGQPFEPKRARQVLCGLACRQKMAGRHRKTPLAPCPTCGAEMTGRTKKFCSVRCRAEAQRRQPIPCPQCGTTFTPGQTRQKFCSKACADKAMELPPKPCELCGEMFRPSGSRAKFCSRACSARATGLAKRKGPLRTPKGYVLLYMPEHPMAMRTGYLLEHRKVMADRLGRMLLPSEVVHHRNEIKDDNRPENLEVLSKPDHDRIPKPPPKPIECPHCGGRIGVSGRVRTVVAL
jgi:HNH endonuclease